MKRAVAVLLASWVLIACAAKAPLHEPDLNGVWFGADKVSRKEMGVLHVDAGRLLWDREESSCSLSYTLLAMYADTLFTNGFSMPLPPEKGMVYKLEVEEEPCVGSIRSFHFFLSAERRGYGELLIYDGKGQQLGWFHLRKQK